MTKYECPSCGNESITPICDVCRAAMRKFGIINVDTKDDYLHWYKWNVDEHTQREINKEICKQNF